MGIKIIDVKIVGLCSKHRKKDDEILKDLNGRAYEDSEISCIGCALGGEEKMKYSCKLCGRGICKYIKDFKESGGIHVQVGKDLKGENLCQECAKETMEQLLDSVGL